MMKIPKKWADCTVKDATHEVICEHYNGTNVLSARWAVPCMIIGHSNRKVRILTFGGRRMPEDQLNIRYVDHYKLREMQKDKQLR